MNQGRQLTPSGGGAAETRGPAASARRPAGSCVGMGGVEILATIRIGSQERAADGPRVKPCPSRAAMDPNRAPFYSTDRSKTLNAGATSREVRA